MIWYYVVGILSFIFGAVMGWLLFSFRIQVQTDGYILLYEDQMYLNLSKDDIVKLSKSDYATLNIKRANFKPYIDN